MQKKSGYDKNNSDYDVFPLICNHLSIFSLQKMGDVRFGKVTVDPLSSASMVVNTKFVIIMIHITQKGVIVDAVVERKSNFSNPIGFQEGLLHQTVEGTFSC